jgi:hypothetical protein
MRVVAVLASACGLSLAAVALHPDRTALEAASKALGVDGITTLQRPAPHFQSDRTSPAAACRSPVNFGSSPSSRSCHPPDRNVIALRADDDTMTRFRIRLRPTVETIHSAMRTLSDDHGRATDLR